VARVCRLTALTTLFLVTRLETRPKESSIWASSWARKLGRLTELLQRASSLPLRVCIASAAAQPNVMNMQSFRSVFAIVCKGATSAPWFVAKARRTKKVLVIFSAPACTTCQSGLSKCAQYSNSLLYWRGRCLCLCINEKKGSAAKQRWLKQNRTRKKHSPCSQCWRRQINSQGRGIEFHSRIKG
jgi:hypothetical protein